LSITERNTIDPVALPFFNDTKTVCRVTFARAPVGEPTIEGIIMSALPSASPKLQATSYELSADSSGRRVVNVDLAMTSHANAEHHVQLALTAQDLDRLIAQLHSAAESVAALSVPEA
jgi:hypothetical protein